MSIQPITATHRYEVPPTLVEGTDNSGRYRALLADSVTITHRPSGTVYVGVEGPRLKRDNTYGHRIMDYWVTGTSCLRDEEKIENMPEWLRLILDDATGRVNL